MSAARPKKTKPIPPRPVQATPLRPVRAVTPVKSAIKKGTPEHHVKGDGRVHIASKLPTLDKGKGKAKVSPTPEKPISVYSTAGEDEEEDDFEEVPIPTGASSPYPDTPRTGTNASRKTTPGTVTTAPSVDDDLVEEGNEDGNGEGSSASGSEEEGDGIIRVEIGGETPEEKAKRIALALRKKPMTSKDRAVRLEAHKLHVISLLASTRIRNRWCSNMLLKARLLSLLPHPLQSAFTIPPSRFPDRAQRSRLFFDALQSLVTWWSSSFFDISDPTLGLRTRPWDEVQEIVQTLPRLSKADLFGSVFITTSSKEQAKEEELKERMSIDAGGERLRSANSLMKKVLQQEGSRDVSAMLFVALARACGLGARLVVSLQVVPWRAEKVGVSKKKAGAGRNGQTVASRQGNGPPSDDDEEEEDEFEEVQIPGIGEEEGAPGQVVEKIQGRKGKGIRAAGRRRHTDPADVYRLRKQRPAVQKSGETKPKKRIKQDLTDQPPVFWAEVFSRSDQRWVPVDPLEGIIRKKTHYEPTSDAGPIRMIYVVAYEEDGYARDVTLRYTKNFGAKTAKLRVPVKKDEGDWWGGVMGFLTRPYRLNRDELEDAELETSHMSEGMPVHMSGFKDHPIYVLERHLKREEVISPKREIGRFRGEPVYRRANVLSCKTAENWMRFGRKVKDKVEPLKWVKQRAVTLNKRRQQEMARLEAGEDIMQGLYAEEQTVVYIPPGIVDGVIPQNSFGNLDLYAPTMLPKGAVHLPYKGIAKIGKALGISYAEACTGFEFKKQRAIPVITGIVVAAENETIVMEAYRESAAMQEEKDRIRREEKALKRWIKLVNGLRVKSRLQAEYGTGAELQEQQLNPLSEVVEEKRRSGGGGKKSAADVIANANKVNAAARREAIERSVSVQSDDGGLLPEKKPSMDGEAQEKADEEDGVFSAVAEAGEVVKEENEEEKVSRETEEAEQEVDSDGDIEMIENPSLHPSRVENDSKAVPPRSSSPSQPISPPAKRTRQPARKRKAPSPVLTGEPRSTRSRGTKTPRKATATTAVPSTRTLRSRAVKSEVEEREEAERNAILRQVIFGEGEDGHEWSESD